MKAPFRILCVLLTLVPCWGHATELKFDDRGVLHVGQTAWGTMYMSPQWRSSVQDKNLDVDTAQDGSVSGSFIGQTRQLLFDYKQSVKRKGPDALRLSCLIQQPAGTETNMLAYQGRLPVRHYAGAELYLDEEPLPLPATFTGEQHLAIRQVRTVRMVTRDGMLSYEGSFTVMVVDDRKFGGNTFSVRFFYMPHQGDIRESSFKTTVTLQPLDLQQLPLKTIANRGFADDRAGDGEGGWTDQGPNNDLSAFSAEAELAGLVPFAIPRSGKSALVLSGDAMRADRASARLPVADTVVVPRYLYLLHASAYTWGDVGKLTVTYQDGSEQRITIKANRDVGNWWNPVDMPNAAVVWSGSSVEANVGLYASRFALEGKPVSSITFEAAGEPTWMVVGATLADQELPLPQPAFTVINRGKDWIPIDTPMVVTPGSALDFSSWTDAPAGKFGHVITTPDGHFAFADRPEQPVRFLGTNLNFSANFLSKEEADKLALRLRQMGYNSVRIHHYDVLLAGGWNPKQYVIDAEMMDRLDYLFYAMKEQGLYISTDLFTIRKIRNPALSGFDADKHAVFKALIPILPAAMDEWKRFARDLLTHKNPYTGMTWAEDPALFSICPVNEDTIWAALRADARVRELYREHFEQWLLEHPRPIQSEADKTMAMNAFLAQVQQTADREMRDFLRDELGCRALVTGNNWKDYLAQVPIRSAYDYVDNHGYWDHPNFPVKPWSYPFSHSQLSATDHLAKIPRRLFLTRIQDVPFTITEYNYTYPNRYRNEGGPLMGAYAALQDYDGLYRFSWAHEAKIATSNQPAQGFDIAQDPIGLLGEHIIAMFWRRGDVPVLEEEAVYAVTPAEAFSGTGATAGLSAEDSVMRAIDLDASAFGRVPPSFEDHHSLLGLTKRVSSRYEPEQSSGNVAHNHAFKQQEPRDRYDVVEGDARVLLERKQGFLVETPYSKALVVQGGSLDETFVSEVTGGPTTVFAGSLDRKPLATTERMLILHLTNVLGENVKFGETGMYSIIDRGDPQKLVKHGTASITVPYASNQAEPKLYALDLAGHRMAKVPFVIDPEQGILTFRADTAGPDGQGVLCYELAR